VVVREQKSVIVLMCQIPAQEERRLRQRRAVTDSADEVEDEHVESTASCRHGLTGRHARSHVTPPLTT